MQHSHEVNVELAHTEKRELQRGLAADLARLQHITDKLAHLLAPATAPQVQQ